MDQYTIAKEMGAIDDIIEGHRKRHQFRRISFPVFKICKESFQAPEWNPVSNLVCHLNVKVVSVLNPVNVNHVNQPPAQAQALLRVPRHQL